MAQIHYFEKVILSWTAFFKELASLACVCINPRLWKMKMSWRWAARVLKAAIIIWQPKKCVFLQKHQNILHPVLFFHFCAVQPFFPCVLKKKNESIVLQHNQSIYGTFIAYYEHIKKTQAGILWNAVFSLHPSSPNNLDFVTLHHQRAKITLLFPYGAFLIMHILHEKWSIWYPNVPLFSIIPHTMTSQKKCKLFSRLF